jgi:putative Mg2+ transporter-C (MgtC) family protein
MIVLWGFEHIERHMTREKTALLTVEYDRESACRERLTERLEQEGYRVATRGFQLKAGTATVEERFDVKWRGSSDASAAPPFTETAIEVGALSVRWTLVR